METKTTKTPRIITGRDLRRMRIHSQLTSAAVAAKLAIKSRKTIENWERDFCEPTITVFMEYCLSTGFNPGRVVEEILKRNSDDPTQIWDIDLEKCLIQKANH